MYTGTVTNTGFSPTATQFETSSITTAAADHWVGRVVIWTSGTLAGQAGRITAYSLNTGRGRFTVTTQTAAPGNGDAFVIV
jgi:NADH dehydrogenase FAD-containing subunit